jgi:hypothetical protein
MMKKYSLPLVLLLVAMPAIPGYGQKGLTIRPYIRAGINLLPPSMEDLDYTGDWSDAEVKVNPMTVGLGSQFLLDKGTFGLGVDFGGGSLFIHKVINDQGVGISTYTDEEYSIYIKFLAEYNLGGILFLQGGIGPHIAAWWYEYYYESANYSDVEDWDSGVGVSLAIMAAAGAEIPISENVNLFLLGKLDGIFRYGMMFPLTANVGLSFKL